MITLRLLNRVRAELEFHFRSAQEFQRRPLVEDRFRREAELASKPMPFQDRWLGQRPLHIDDRNRGDMTREHRQRPAVLRPDNLATATAIAHVKELPHYRPIGSLQPDVELGAVEDGNFLTNRDDLAVWRRHSV